MKIALIADNINFPSLPLMKLSSYHKKLGDIVMLIDEDFKRYPLIYPKFDICYVSKTFNLPALKRIDVLKDLPIAERYVFGGSGYAIEVVNGREVYSKSEDNDLLPEIEHIYPDYSLYPKFKAAYGFLTRGCPKGCEFCIVKCKEGVVSHKVADLFEFWRGQKEIVLLDPNILACNDRENLIQQLISSKAAIDYTQGLDATFVDNDIAKLVNQTRIKTIHFAFDLMKNEAAICRGLEIFKKYNSLTQREQKVYILTNFNTTHEEDLYRVKKVMELGYQPDVRIYRKGAQTQFLTDLARWANNKIIYNSTSFEDYKPRADGKTIKQLYAI